MLLKSFCNCCVLIAVGLNVVEFLGSHHKLCSERSLVDFASIDSDKCVSVQLQYESGEDLTVQDGAHVQVSTT